MNISAAVVSLGSLLTEWHLTLQEKDDTAAAITAKFNPHKDYYKAGPFMMLLLLLLLLLLPESVTIVMAPCHQQSAVVKPHVHLQLD